MASEFNFGGSSPDYTSSEAGPVTDNQNPPIAFDFSRDTYQTTTPVEGGVALQRAQKWNYGLGDRSPGPEALLNQIGTGAEGEEARLQAQRIQGEQVQYGKEIVDKTLAKGTLTPEDMALVNPILQGIHIQPLDQLDKDLFEKMYARRVVTYAADAFFKGKMPSEPDFAAMDYAERLIHIKEGAQKLAENYEANYQKTTSWAGAAFYQGQRFVPLLWDARVRSEFFALTGNDLAKQYQEILTMENASDALALVRERVEPMYKTNPVAALRWLHGLANYSSSEAVLDNIFSVIDFGTVPGVTGGTLALSRRLRNTVAAVSGRTTDPAKLLEAVGDTHSAAKILAVRELEAKAELTGTKVDATTPYINNLSDLRSQTVTGQMGPATLEKGNFTLSREKAQRIAWWVEEKNKEADLLTKEGNIRISRLDPKGEAMKVAETETDAMFNKYNPHIADHILDVRTSNLDDYITSNYNRVYKLGTKTSQLEDIPGVTAAKGTINLQGKPLELIHANTNMGKEQLDAIRRLRVAASKSKDPAEKATLEATIKEIRKQSQGGYGGEAPFSSVRYDVKAGNENFVTVYGNKQLNPFVTREGAAVAASKDFKFHPGTYDIKPYGDGWAIEVHKAIDEFSTGVRQALADQTKGENPKNYLSLFRAWLPLSKNSKIDAKVMEAANIVGYGTKNQTAYIAKVLEPIGELYKTSGAAGKKAWEDFNGFIDAQRILRNKDGTYGKFSSDFGEFEQDWFKQYGRMPTDKEHHAYWAYVKLSDDDWVLRNLGLHTTKTSHGAELFGLPTSGGKIAPNIEGKLVKELPFDSSARFSFLQWNKDADQITKHSSLTTRGIDRTNLQEGIASGRLKVIQLGQYSDEQLKSLGYVKLPKGAEDVNYIVTDSFERAPLGLQHIPNRPGGHHAYDYPYHIKQPILKDTGAGRTTTTWYHGDTHFAGANTEKEAIDITKRLEIARQHLLRSIDHPLGDAGALETYLNRELPNLSLRHFVTSFEGFGGTLNPRTPFYAVPNGKSVDSYAKLEDLTKATKPNHKYIRASESPHNLYSGDPFIQFTQERTGTMYAFENAGTSHNPIYNFQSAKMVDPMVVAQRASENIANSRLLDDLKIKAAERLVAEFSDVMMWDISRIRSDPLKAILESEINPKAPQYAKSAYKDARRATLELLGLKTSGQQTVDWVFQKLKETLPNNKAGAFVADHLLPTIRDADKAVKALGFHQTQGMFNPAAFVNQAQQVFHVAAIEPKYAVQAGVSGTITRYANFMNMDEAAIRQVAKYQSLPADHFVEMTLGMRRSGFHKVGKEVADYGQWIQSNVVQGKAADAGGALLDWGKVFFNMGEATGRNVAYPAAYMRWRAANPEAAFDSVAQAQVLARADFLNLNMSGVSNSVLQRGIPGVITQFFSAHLRQAEQIFTGKLSPAEVIRLVSVNSLLYGLPVGLGATLTAGLWPVSQTVNEYAQRYSWSPYDGFATNTLMNGLISAAIEQAGGSKYDVSTLGLGGINFIRDLMDAKNGTASGDQIAGLMMGMSGKATKNLLESFYPLTASLLSLGNYPLKFEDIKDFLDNNVSTMKNAEKAFTAIAFGKYFSKTEGVQADVSKVGGAIAALTGVKPQSISDMYAILHDDKQFKAFQQGVEKEFQINIRRALEAHNQKPPDLEGYYSFWKRANLEFQRGQFLEKDRPKMVARALDMNRPLVESVFKRTMETHGQTPEALEAYKRRLKAQGK